MVDGRTGEVLASHAARRELPIASTTKLMTAYLAMQELPLRKRVRAAPYTAIPGESLLGLTPASRSAFATCSTASSCAAATTRPRPGAWRRRDPRRASSAR